MQEVWFNREHFDWRTTWTHVNLIFQVKKKNIQKISFCENILLLFKVDEQCNDLLIYKCRYVKYQFQTCNVEKNMLAQHNNLCLMRLQLSLDAWKQPGDWIYRAGDINKTVILKDNGRYFKTKSMSDEEMFSFSSLLKIQYPAWTPVSLFKKTSCQNTIT